MVENDVVQEIEKYTRLIDDAKRQVTQRLEEIAEYAESLVRVCDRALSPRTRQTFLTPEGTHFRHHHAAATEVEGAAAAVHAAEPAAAAAAAPAPTHRRGP
jgi:hypothetical protein